MSPATAPCLRAWRSLCCFAFFRPSCCGVCGGASMTIFGEVESSRGRGPREFVPSDFRRFIRPVAILLTILVAVLIFFNYIAKVTRIGAGYVGVEILLS